MGQRPNGLRLRRHRQTFGPLHRVKLPNSNEYSGDSYYYETNQQGDVTGLYKITYDAATKSLSATRVASYEYDAWGNVTYSTGEMADINPLRYRGYYQTGSPGITTCKADITTRQSGGLSMRIINSQQVVI
ncbi:MAG: hypothetical protein V8S89_03895 [Oscillospiraceae bacterium]